METFILLIRLLLAGVLATAGIAKLFDLSGSRQAMLDFGLPPSFAAPLGVLLPIVEIAIALTLLPAVTAWVSAIDALVLFLLFIGGMVYNLARGRTPNCHCFGQLHSQPIGRGTLIRNGVLALLAAFVVAQGPHGVGPGLVEWLASLSATTYLILIVALLVGGVIVGQGWVVLNLLRQNGRLLLRLEAIEKHLGLTDPTEASAQNAPAAEKGLPVGSPAPLFQLSALDGSQQSLATLLAPGKPLLLFFSSATCGPCNELMGEVVQWQKQYADRLTIATINRGTAADVRAKAGELNPAYALLQEEAEVAATYQIAGTPSAVLVGVDGRIRSAMAGGAVAVRELVSNASRPVPLMADQLLRRAPIQLDTALPTPLPQANVPVIGAPAPAFQLPNLAGETVEPSHFQGESSLLLFWNPSCGFCRRMLSDLQAWEAAPQAGAPRLVLISAGTVEANQAQGLSSPILLDNGFATGFAYGAKGTPSALLIDAQGKVASPLVVGATAIMPMLTDASEGAQQAA